MRTDWRERVDMAVAAGEPISSIATMFDLVIRGGDVVDGTGSPARRADVAVRGDRIAAVGELDEAVGRVEIDAAGMIVAPGFIDVHTHSDAAPFLPDRHLDLRLATIRQGVTTEVCGNCGFSLFPVGSRHPEAVRRWLAALLGDDAPAFESAADMSEAVETAGLIGNLGILAGHGSLRAAVIGFDDRAPTTAEQDEMRDLLRVALEEGALGLSSGLVYAPARFAATDELISLAAVAAELGRPYVTHVRSEKNEVVAALDEAVAIGRASAAAVHVSHLKVAGPANHGLAGRSLAILDDARASGVDVTGDAYPYTAGSTMLSSLLPPWVAEGGIEALLERIADPALRARIAADFSTGAPGWESYAEDGWGSVAIASAPGHPEWEGMRVPALAAEMGVAELDAVCEALIAEQGRVIAVIHSMDEGDVREFLAWPHAMVGSDGIPLPGKPHPRWAGTFARLLGRYTSDGGLFSFEEGVRRMTTLAADRFGLSDRGRISEGAFADLVVLRDIVDRATYDDPLLPAAGVHHVLVNGKAVIDHGRPTKARPGRVVGPGR